MIHERRADIDGLRAIAVLSVLFYHCTIPFFSGGFVGVDVFFVISGYLIGGQIYERLAQNPGTFRDFLGWFYERRVRRILPAFFFISALTYAAGLIVFLPDRLAMMARVAALCDIILGQSLFCGPGLLLTRRAFSAVHTLLVAGRGGTVLSDFSGSTFHYLPVSDKDGRVHADCIAGHFADRFGTHAALVADDRFLLVAVSRVGIACRERPRITFRGAASKHDGRRRICSLGPASGCSADPHLFGRDILSGSGCTSAVPWFCADTVGG